jgi:NhaA family Na+:H+ antiporter
VAISHFSSEEDVDLNKRTILSNHQMDWLKQVESASDKVISPLQDLEDTLHPMVNYLIIPLFAFANAGIVLQGLDVTTVFSGVSLAIICGLVLGKVLGIFSFSWLAIKMRLAPMPQNSNWKMLVSVAMLGGIGFTVSMFIANLSFGSAEMGNAELLSQSKLGIVVGSLLAGLLGYLLLRLTLPKADELHEENE